MTARAREDRSRPARGRIRRLTARALVVAILGGGALSIAVPAGAISLPFIGNCKSAPQPQPPGTGLSGFVETKPDPLPAPAPAFGAHAGSTEYVQYGYAGLSWSLYDLGCVPNPITSWGYLIDNELGNWLLGSAKSAVAIDNTVHAWASDPSWAAALTPIVGGANSALYKALFVTWAAAALMTVGISVAFRAHRSDTPAAVTLAAWALFVITLVAGVVAAPGWAGQQAAALMGSTLNAMDAGFAGPGAQANAAQAHASLTVSAVLYPSWLRGEFGDPSSPAAQQYGPQLFEAQALTWNQAAGSPQQVNATVKAEGAQWEKIAGELKKNYPQTYPALQGTGGGRFAAGTLALLTALIACTYDFIASLVVIIALLGVMAGVIMLPALAVVGMHHGMRHLLTGTGSRIAGMLINGLLWGAGAGVDDLATRTLLTQAVVPAALALLLLALLPFGLYATTRKLRGRDAVPRPVKRAAMLALGYAAVRRGSRDGAEAAAADLAGANATPLFWRDPWTWRTDRIPPNYPPLGGGGPNPPPNLPPGGGGGPNPPPNLPPGGGGGGGGGGGPRWNYPPNGSPSPNGSHIPPSGSGPSSRPDPGPGAGSGPRDYAGPVPERWSGSDVIIPANVFHQGRWQPNPDTGDTAGASGADADVPLPFDRNGR